MTVRKKIEAYEMIIELKARSKYAFSVLYDNYAPALLGIATKIVGDHEIAEDVLQEVFVKIWRNVDSYEASKGSLFTWMLNITRNASIDYLRSKHHRYQSRTVGNGLDSVDVSATTSPSNYKDESDDLPRMIQKLDGKYKQVIDLVYIYGYSQTEVSQMLKIPKGTVKTRCRYAIQQLKSKLY